MELAEENADFQEKSLEENNSPSKKRRKGEKDAEEETTKGKSPAKEQREKALADKEDKGYSRLEQKYHEKTRVGSTKRSEKLARFKNKGV